MLLGESGARRSGNRTIGTGHPPRANSTDAPEGDLSYLFLEGLFPWSLWDYLMRYADRVSTPGGARTMDRPEHPIPCEACRTIDRADGVEDGKLYRSFAPPRAEHPLRRGLEHLQHLAADAVSGFAGSIPFIYIHVVWFTLWVSINLGAFGRAREFDPFPFGLLTMIVSLE